MLHGRERVGGLAALADGDDEIVRQEDRIAIADLATDLDRGRDAGDLFDPVAARHGGVRARSAGHEVHAAERLRELFGDAHLARDDVGGLEVDAAAQRVLDGPRLLVDLLEHEVLVAALLGLGGRPVDALGRTRDHRAVGDGGDGQAVAPEDGHLAVLQEDHVAGVREDGGDVARGEALAFAGAEHER